MLGGLDDFMKKTGKLLSLIVGRKKRQKFSRLHRYRYNANLALHRSYSNFL